MNCLLSSFLLSVELNSSRPQKPLLISQPLGIRLCARIFTMKMIIFSWKRTTSFDKALSQRFLDTAKTSKRGTLSFGVPFNVQCLT